MTTDSDASSDSASYGQVDVGVPLTLCNATACRLRACRHCGTVWEGAADNDRCTLCLSLLPRRKIDSLTRTWAFLIAACILYIPANLLPVMVTTSLLDTQQDTIMSGILYFWLSGSWELAVVVFIASFMVPLFKLLSLIVLTVSARQRSSWQRLQRAKLYRILEIIGRWSMLDVFVVTLLVGLVQFEGFAEVTAGMGVAAFGAVVVLTILASLSFDPRLIWDDAQECESSGFVVKAPSPACQEQDFGQQNEYKDKHD